MPSSTNEVADALAERALAQAGGDPLTALAMLDVREAKRQKTQYIKYFQPCGDAVKLFEQWQPQHKIVLLLGGNGSSKTMTGAGVATAFALGKDYFSGSPAEWWVNKLPIPEHPSSIRVVGLNSDLLKDPIWEKLTAGTDHPSFFPQDGSVAEQKGYAFYARFKNGAKLQGKSADVDPKTHGGPTLDLVWIDEECDFRIFEENYQRIRKGGYLLVTATPLDDVGMSLHPWIFDLIEKAEAGDPEILVIFMSSLNNPHLDEDYKRKQIARWKGHPDEMARLYGRPVRRTGLYYNQWAAQPPLWVPASTIDRDAFRAVVIDPASNGPSAALWLAFNRRGKMTVYREYKEKGLTASQHVENILLENRGDPTNLWLMDPFMGRQTVHSTGDEQQTVMDIWRKAGLSRLRLAEIDYEFCLQESREYIKAAFDPTDPHPGMEVFDHLDKFKDEIERCVIDAVQVGANRGTSKERPRKGNDDLLNCWQYACGMRLRARAGAAPAAYPAGSTSYFDAPVARAATVKSSLKPWTDEPW